MAAWTSASGSITTSPAPSWTYPTGSGVRSSPRSAAARVVRQGVLALGRLGALAHLGHRGLAKIDHRRPLPVAAADLVLAVHACLPAHRWSCWPAPPPPRPARARPARRRPPATAVLCG